MTIKERFAKYTDKEIKAGIARLKEKISENEEAMRVFKAERNVEFFNVAKEQYEENVLRLMDAEAALADR